MAFHLRARALARHVALVVQPLHKTLTQNEISKIMKNGLFRKLAKRWGVSPIFQHMAHPCGAFAKDLVMIGPAVSPPALAQKFHRGSDVVRPRQRARRRGARLIANGICTFCDAREPVVYDRSKPAEPRAGCWRGLRAPAPDLHVSTHSSIDRTMRARAEGSSLCH